MRIPSSPATTTEASRNPVVSRRTVIATLTATIAASSIRPLFHRIEKHKENSEALSAMDSFPATLAHAEFVDVERISNARQFAVIIAHVHGTFIPPEQEKEMSPFLHQAKKVIHANTEKMLSDYKKKAGDHFPRTAYCEGVKEGNAGAQEALEQIMFTRDLDAALTSKYGESLFSAPFSSLPEELQKELSHPARIRTYAAFPPIIRQWALDDTIEIRGIASPEIDDRAMHMMHDWENTESELLPSELEERYQNTQLEREAYALQTVVAEGRPSYLLFQGFEHSNNLVWAIQTYNQNSSNSPIAFGMLVPVGVNELGEAIQQTLQSKHVARSD